MEGFQKAVDSLFQRDGCDVYITGFNAWLMSGELASLRKIRDSFPKYLITLDELFGEMDYEGIRKINVLKWLLGD